MIKPYYDDGRGIVIYHGDCREILPQLPKVDLVLTDPPYFLPACHHSTREGTSKSWGNLSILEHFFSDTFKELQSILNPEGWMYCFCDGQSYPIFYKACYSIFKSIRPLVWDKLTSLNGYWWRHQHELILFACQHDTELETTGDGDVLRFRSVPMGDRLHDAQKPLELLTKLMSKGEPELTLDPFMGSGTTLRAAKDLGRKAIGIEIEERYAEIAARRLEQEVLPLEDVSKQNTRIQVSVLEKVEATQQALC